MTVHTQQPERTLYVIVCGAGPAEDVATLIRLAQAQGWTVYVVTTPAGRDFINVPELEALTGHPVRTDLRKPTEPSPSWPLPDTVIVAPTTINTICKWAAGVADNLALSILYECMGVDVPIVTAPNVNPSLGRHPAFRRSIADLRAWGVHVLYEHSAPPPVWMASWEQILDALPRPQ